MSDPLLDDIRTLPTGYQEHINTALPALPALPADVDAAQLVCGQLAQYLLDVFAGFEGLHPLKIPYLMGQGNEAVLGLLMASLQITGVSLGIYPGFPAQDANTVAPGDYQIACAVVGVKHDTITAVELEIGTDIVTLDYEDGSLNPLVYRSGLYTLDIGTYTATYRVSLNGGDDLTKTVSFDVAEGGESGGGGASSEW